MKKSGKNEGCIESRPRFLCKMFACLAVAFGALWLFSASICVVPELEAANSRFCVSMLVLFLISASLAVAFARCACFRDKRNRNRQFPRIYGNREDERGQLR